ncbi:DNA repair helicase XPB [Leucobacter sp. OH1287]|uniref:DNA repair helicase XPB n=1 Tax=Leucobacter sp. OH1287 TaxID=2491049 RepID=UPI000F5E2DE4|nr:DNA repair helicase XPB [Leucobacter sp. OH1287]RRD61104.1 DEAD/DEAH box helicase [Leucobacter sp. OH1287]
MTASSHTTAAASSLPGPLIVQSDNTLLLEVHHPDADAARHELAIFAELERAPEHIHSYRITQVGLWNARAAGHTADEVLEILNRFSKFPVPDTIARNINDVMDRYGRLEIVRAETPEVAGSTPQLLLRSNSPAILREVASNKKVASLLTEKLNENSYLIADWARGELKQQLLQRGWPAADHAGYQDGAFLDAEITEQDWRLRDYQREAVARFSRSGSGVVVLPCGAGKTIVGAAAIAALKTHTLILVTNTVSARQWRDELLRRTNLTVDEIGEYSGQIKEVKPVTIATYQILTARRGGKYSHLSLLSAADWGFIVYDEVHLLPAPVFKLTAELQAKRRLGLTATLVREDGKEGEVFSLIGPKRFDAPWKDLEQQGYIAPATCYEVRVDLPATDRFKYAAANDQDRYRIAASTTAKIPVAKQIIEHHGGDAQTLVIGQYLDQLEQFAAELDAPLITGKTPVSKREQLFQRFREREIKTLVVSKVANFSVDLPDASVAIQISGSYGSRQEEAQRLGRLLRPKSNGESAAFYTIVTKDTVDQDFAQHRQRFLTEQGYSYLLGNAADLDTLWAQNSARS